MKFEVISVVEESEHAGRCPVCDSFVSSIDLESPEGALFYRCKKCLSILKEVEEDYEKGFAIAKVWFAPRWKDYVKNKWDFQFDVQNFSLNEPILEPVFSLLEDLGSILLLHVSDPDILYKTNYQPESYYGSKSEHLLILEKLLENYPKKSTNLPRPLLKKLWKEELKMNT